MNLEPPNPSGTRCKNTYGVDDMRIKGGYGKNVIEHNIVEYVNGGYSEEEARQIALKIARKFFVKRNPDKELPGYLEG